MNWDEFDREVRKLAALICDFKPDVVVGIARGGVVPAVIISKVLGVRDMYVLKMRREGEKRTIMAETVPDLSGKNVLLVEDMIETGKSLIVASEYTNAKGAHTKTACLYTMPTSEIRPDYSLKEIPEPIRFPWE